METSKKITESQNRQQNTSIVSAINILLHFLSPQEIFNIAKQAEIQNSKQYVEITNKYGDSVSSRNLQTPSPIKLSNKKKTFTGEYYTYPVLDGKNYAYDGVDSVREIVKARYNFILTTDPINKTCIRILKSLRKHNICSSKKREWKSVTTTETKIVKYSFTYYSPIALIIKNKSLIYRSIKQIIVGHRGRVILSGDEDLIGSTDIAVTSMKSKLKLDPNTRIEQDRKNNRNVRLKVFNTKRKGRRSKKRI